MWRKALIGVVILILPIGCATGQRLTKTAARDWSSVMALPPGESIEAVTTEGRRVTGTLKLADANRIMLDPLSIQVNRADIQSVWAFGSADRLRNGAVLGGLVGLISGLAARQDDAAAVLLPTAATIVGGAAGAWFDRGWNGAPRTLVYTR